ncbi:MAG: hypothetical protein IKX59_08310 [Bacteroidales bacterium]|nr:hypothetical protein [Bacteroidales bacterium]
MPTINVYQQYFEADCTHNGVKRHAASVLLISNSECGNISYEVAVSFFPHNDADDFAVSYDAYFSRTVYEAPGRRSKKREKELLDNLRLIADELATEAQGVIFWDRPLTDEQRG